MPNLIDNGDEVERATWGKLRDFFPHYEEFWLAHAVPLRAENSIQFRRGIDEDFEFLAMRSYSTYVNLARAHDRIYAPEESLFFPDDIYALLHRSAELAKKVMAQFGRLYEACLARRPKIEDSALDSFMARIVEYRNLIHDEFVGVVRTDAGRLMVPKDDRLERYRKWTDVLYRHREEDFIDVSAQLANHFRSLASALESCWKQMCELSSDLVSNKEYLRKRAQGKTVPVAGSTFVVVNALSSVAASAVIVQNPKPRG